MAQVRHLAYGPPMTLGKLREQSAHPSTAAIPNWNSGNLK
jgi:hypothetical protein